jgi:hypothetical protein
MAELSSYGIEAEGHHTVRDRAPCALLSIAGYTFMLATLLGIKALRTRSNFVIINLAVSGIVNLIVRCFFAPVDPRACATQVRERTSGLPTSTSGDLIPPCDDDRPISRPGRTWGTAYGWRSSVGLAFIVCVGA